MALLDDLLGGGGNAHADSATNLDAVVGTSPAVGIEANDVLGLIGSVGVDVSAPTVIGLSASNETSTDGGLLGGIL